jgi:hypothetical protein
MTSSRPFPHDHELKANGEMIVLEQGVNFDVIFFDLVPERNKRGAEHFVDRLEIGGDRGLAEIQHRHAVTGNNRAMSGR